MKRTAILGLTLAMALIGTAHAQTGGAKADLVKRGDYLVNTLMTCGNCHTPKGPTGDIMAKAFSGGLSWDEPPFKVTAPNITQDKETGIGGWSDADIKKLLRTGVRPDGTPVAMVMPSSFYQIISERDIDAIVAYLRTLKPMDTDTIIASVHGGRQGHMPTWDERLTPAEIRTLALYVHDLGTRQP